MSILIGALEFDGPVSDLDLLESVSGVYAILCENNGEYELLELGDADDVREHIYNHPQRNEWCHNHFNIALAVHYAADLTEAERKEIRCELEREFDEVEVAA